jgi:hypothetical protein
MFIVQSDRLLKYRSTTFRLNRQLHLKNERGAVRFINDRGFVLFWPGRNILLPSIWSATAGDRAVPDNHDDPGHITWRWKDNLLGKKRCYYGRIIRKRNTFISLAVLPYFYTLSPNYGDAENDYLIQYEQGLLPVEAKMIYKAILSKGAMDTLALKRAAHLSSPTNESRFNRSLDILQRDFRILPIGIAEAGSWRYAFIYEAVHRHFPELITQSHNISENEARKNLILIYLKTVGACSYNDLQRLFRWEVNQTKQMIENLIKTNLIILGKSDDGDQTSWIIHPDFVI